MLEPQPWKETLVRLEELPGKPVAGAEIICAIHEVIWNKSRTDNEGRCRVTMPHDLGFRLSALPKGARRVDLYLAGTDNEQPSITLPFLPPIRGRVLDPAGVPAPDVIGSISATNLYYAGGLTSIVGLQGNTSGFLNVSLPIAAIARNAGVVTVTTAGNLPVDVNGLTMTVSGVADQSYNGSFTVTTTGANSLTYAESGANSTSTGGTVSKLTGGYVLYPMAEVLGVFNATTKSVDGQLTLAANTVPWGANDPVEEPHYYQEHVVGRYYVCWADDAAADDVADRRCAVRGERGAGSVGMVGE